jgi:hypothetical protein
VIKLPIKKIPGVPGSLHSGVECKNPQCGTGIALGGDLNSLPSPFAATCPLCGETHCYRTNELEMFEQVRKQ